MIALALLLATNGHWQSYGFPNADTCADWTLDRTTRRSQANEGWVLGFLSGLNAYRLPSGGIGNGVNGTAILAWMDKRCAENPLEPVPTAAFTLADELQRRERPTPVSPTNRRSVK